MHNQSTHQTRRLTGLTQEGLSSKKPGSGGEIPAQSFLYVNIYILYNI
jgi:hypothetical protein